MHIHMYDISDLSCYLENNAGSALAVCQSGTNGTGSNPSKKYVFLGKIDIAMLLCVIDIRTQFALFVCLNAK
jgi:hypothetical protein